MKPFVALIGVQAAFVIFRNDIQSKAGRASRTLFTAQSAEVSELQRLGGCDRGQLHVLEDIWGGESTRVGVDTPFNLTLRRRQTFFFTVSNCSRLQPIRHTHGRN